MDNILSGQELQDIKFTDIISNTSQISAYIDNLDKKVVHIENYEEISGVKTFTNGIKLDSLSSINDNSIDLNNNTFITNKKEFEDNELITKQYANTLSTTYFEANLSSDNEELINETLNSFKGKNGDIAVIKTNIYNTLFSNTAYIYNNLDNNISDNFNISSNWKALDGNYNTTNVYFKKNLKLGGDYTNVGNIKLVDNVLSCAGKSVDYMFKEIFQKALKPLFELPTAIFYNVGNREGEVGTTYTLDNGIFKINNFGNYQYGTFNTSTNKFHISSDTGITELSVNLEFFNDENINTNSISGILNTENNKLMLKPDISLTGNIEFVDTVKTYKYKVLNQKYSGTPESYGQRVTNIDTVWPLETAPLISESSTKCIDLQCTAIGWRPFYIGESKLSWKTILNNINTNIDTNDPWLFENNNIFRYDYTTKEEKPCKMDKPTNGVFKISAIPNLKCVFIIIPKSSKYNVTKIEQTAGLITDITSKFTGTIASGQLPQEFYYKNLKNTDKHLYKLFLYEPHKITETEKYSITIS